MAKTSCMNKSQGDYATDRIRSMRDRIINAMRKECVQQEKVSFTDDEKISIIKDILKNNKKYRGIRYRSSYVNGFDFSALEKPEVIDGEKFAILKSEVIKNAQRTLDSIMLGNPAEALEELVKFENKYRMYLEEK